MVEKLVSWIYGVNVDYTVRNDRMKKAMEIVETSLGSTKF